MNRKLTYQQWQQIHNKKVVNTIKGYLLGFTAAAFPLLLLAHYLIIGY
nr:MAG TPA: hypothetical protein [Caudoviricetes sp.]